MSATAPGAGAAEEKEALDSGHAMEAVDCWVFRMSPSKMSGCPGIGGVLSELKIQAVKNDHRLNHTPLCLEMREAQLGRPGKS